MPCRVQVMTKKRDKHKPLRSKKGQTANQAHEQICTYVPSTHTHTHTKTEIVDKNREHRTKDKER